MITFSAPVVSDSAWFYFVVRVGTDLLEHFSKRSCSPLSFRPSLCFCVSNRISPYSHILAPLPKADCYCQLPHCLSAWQWGARTFREEGLFGLGQYSPAWLLFTVSCSFSSLYLKVFYYSVVFSETSNILECSQV